MQGVPWVIELIISSILLPGNGSWVTFLWVPFLAMKTSHNLSMLKECVLLIALYPHCHHLCCVAGKGLINIDCLLG